VLLPTFATGPFLWLSILIWVFVLLIKFFFNFAPRTIACAEYFLFFFAWTHQWVLLPWFGTPIWTFSGVSLSVSSSNNMHSLSIKTYSILSYFSDHLLLLNTFVMDRLIVLLSCLSWRYLSWIMCLLVLLTHSSSSITAIVWSRFCFLSLWMSLSHPYRSLADPQGNGHLNCRCGLCFTHSHQALVPCLSMFWQLTLTSRLRCQIHSLPVLCGLYISNTMFTTWFSRYGKQVTPVHTVSTDNTQYNAEHVA